jgi:hypothetical protein
MAKTKDYVHALEKLQSALSQAESHPNFNNVTSNRDIVLVRYNPAFQFDTVQYLSEETFRSFLYFENNHHWSGLNRKGLKLCENMPALRDALATLLNPTLPLADRWNSSVRNLRGLGKALATAILIVSSPSEFGVWNNTSERALRTLNIWPDFPRGSFSGQKYGIINQLLNHLALDLSIDLWTLDALMWRVIPKDLQTREANTPGDSPDAVSFETIGNALKTIKEYRDYYDPEGSGWAEYVYEIFHVLGFSTEKIDSRLSFLKDMGNKTPQVLVLCNLPQEDKVAIAPGIRWDSYLRFAASYYDVKWGILTNGLQLQVFSYGNRNNDAPLFWSDLDETIKNQRLEGFYSLHKTLSSLRNENKLLDRDHTTHRKLRRESWEERANHRAMAVVDAMIKIVREVAEPRVSYAKSRIAIGTSGKYFIWCHPRKVPHLRLRLRVGEDMDILLEKFALRGIQCSRGTRFTDRIRLTLTDKEVAKNGDILREVVRIAEELSRQ